VSLVISLGWDGGECGADVRSLGWDGGDCGADGRLLKIASLGTPYLRGVQQARHWSKKDTRELTISA
jgi:hypothetical protein